MLTFIYDYVYFLHSSTLYVCMHDSWTGWTHMMRVSEDRRPKDTSVNTSTNTDDADADADADANADADADAVDEHAVPDDLDLDPSPSSLLPSPSPSLSRPRARRPLSATSAQALSRLGFLAKRTIDVARVLGLRAGPGQGPGHGPGQGHGPGSGPVTAAGQMQAQLVRYCDDKLSPECYAIIARNI